MPENNAPRPDVQDSDEHQEARPQAPSPFLEDVEIGESWTALKERLELVNSTHLNETYAEDLTRLDGLFNSLRPEDTDFDEVGEKLLEVGLSDEEAGEATDSMYAAYRHGLRSVLLVLENAEDFLIDGLTGQVDTEGSKKFFGLVRAVSMAGDSNGDTASVTTIASEVQAVVTTPFKDFSEKLIASAGLDTSGATSLERLNIGIRATRLETDRIIQKMIEDSSLYDFEDFEEGRPWERSGRNTVSFSAEQMARDGFNFRESAEGRDFSYYREEARHKFNLLKEKIAEQSDLTINTWGFDDEGDKQIDETRRGFLGLASRREVSPKQGVVYQRQHVRTYGIDRNGNPIERLVPIQVAALSIREARYVGGENLAFGESSTSLKLVDQYVYTVEGMDTNSPIKAQENLWRLEVAVRVERSGRIYYKVPVIRNGEPCWLPLSEQQYNSWKSGLQITLYNFDRAGLSYLDVKRRQGEDERAGQSNGGEIRFSVESGLEESDPSRIWFNNQLQAIGIRKRFEGIETADLSQGRRDHFESIRTSIISVYSEFIYRYGNGGCYYELADKILLDQRILPDAEGYESRRAEVVAEIIEEYERLARILSRLSSSESETLTFFESFPIMLGDSVGWEFFAKMPERYGELYNALGMDYPDEGFGDESSAEESVYSLGFGETTEEADEETSEQVGGETEEDVGGETVGDGGGSSDEGEPMPEERELHGVYDAEAWETVEKEVQSLLAAGRNKKEIQRELRRKYHPDNVATGSHKHFVVIDAYLRVGIHTPPKNEEANPGV